MKPVHFIKSSFKKKLVSYLKNRSFNIKIGPLFIESQQNGNEKLNFKKKCKVQSPESNYSTKMGFYF